MHDASFYYQFENAKHRPQCSVNTDTRISIGILDCDLPALSTVNRGDQKPEVFYEFPLREDVASYAE